MKKIFKRIAIALGLAKRDGKHIVWAIMFKTKPELVKEGTVAETFLCGNLFGTEYEAMRHVESLMACNDVTGYDILGIVKIETKEDVTVTKYDYTITDEHPKITVEYEEL